MERKMSATVEGVEKVDNANGLANKSSDFEKAGKQEEDKSSNEFISSDPLTFRCEDMLDNEDINKNQPPTNYALARTRLAHREYT